MRKRLLFVTLLLVSQYCLKAQMFLAPDTVCVRQPVQLTSLVPGQASQYWGFCSGYLLNNPTGVNLGATPYLLDGPKDIEIVKDGDKYYGFAIAGGINNSFERIEYGTSLSSTPTVTNYGNFDGALPIGLNSLFVVKDSAKNHWHIFITAGTTAANSEMARIDFDDSLMNVPNIVNFGNVGSVLNGPNGMFIGKEADKWYGYVLNKSTNSLVRMDMDTNISLTPALTDLGPVGTLNGPHDLAPIRDAGNWYFFITNENDNSISRIDIGPSLNITSIPTNTNFPDISLFGPNGITLIRDCGSLYAFITQKTSHEIVRVNMASVTGPYTFDPLGPVGSPAAPTGISHMIRDKDNVYAYVANYGDGTISRITFAQCTNSSIPYSTTKRPPVYTYTTPGIYNIYYAVNEGTPDMQVDCKLITVLEVPPMLVSNDTTICQGDTIALRALSINALSVTWSPNFNITGVGDVDIRAWPDYSTQYHILLPYANGCIVDTTIDVTVRKVRSDAGPDRTLTDGTTTLLGGPFTSEGAQYAYTWTPNQFLNDNVSPNVVAKPPFDFTYYLTVRDTAGCTDIDTVVVRVACNDLNLPNAFIPNSSSNSSTATFGLANRQLVKLNFFRIYDRWGKEVFNTTDPMKQWDGTIDGHDAAMGVYVWEADGFCLSGQRIQRSGNVTLIR